MKKLCKFWISAALFSLLMAASVVQATPSVRFELSDSSIAVGDMFSLGVFIDGVDNTLFWGFPTEEVTSFGFDVNSGTAIDFTSAVVGSPFNDDSSFFPNTDVAGSAFPAVTGGNILLATLSFQAIAEGSSFVGILSDLTDPNEGLMGFGPSFSLAAAFDITGGLDINVAAAPVPEPATMLLFGSGLVGLAGSRLRRRKKS